MRVINASFIFAFSLCYKLSDESHLDGQDQDAAGEKVSALSHLTRTLWRYLLPRPLGFDFVTQSWHRHNENHEPPATLVCKHGESCPIAPLLENPRLQGSLAQMCPHTWKRSGTAKSVCSYRHAACLSLICPWHLCETVCLILGIWRERERGRERKSENVPHKNVTFRRSPPPASPITALTLGY